MCTGRLSLLSPGSAPKWRVSETETAPPAVWGSLQGVPDKGSAGQGAQTCTWPGATWHQCVRAEGKDLEAVTGQAAAPNRRWGESYNPFSKQYTFLLAGTPGQPLPGVVGGPCIDPHTWYDVIYKSDWQVKPIMVVRPVLTTLDVSCTESWWQIESYFPLWNCSLYTVMAPWPVLSNGATGESGPLPWWHSSGCIPAPAHWDHGPLGVQAVRGWLPKSPLPALPWRSLVICKYDSDTAQKSWLKTLTRLSVYRFRFSLIKVASQVNIVMNKKKELAFETFLKAMNASKTWQQGKCGISKRAETQVNRCSTNPSAVQSEIKWYRRSGLCDFTPQCISQFADEWNDYSWEIALQMQILICFRSRIIRLQNRARNRECGVCAHVYAHVFQPTRPLFESTRFAFKIDGFIIFKKSLGSYYIFFLGICIKIFL